MTTKGPKRLKAVDSADIVRADEAVAAREAFRLRKDGYTLFQIAEILKKPESQVMRLMKTEVNEAARMVTDGARSDLLTLEVARLDDLQRAVWPAAMSGDTRAVDSALKVIAHRAKLLGLEQAQVETLNQTVVINSDSKSYTETLKMLAAGITLEEEAQ